MKFRFRPSDTIGRLSAEDDKLFLEECFVDTGILDVLRDLSNTAGLLTGRTGAGKTALLQVIQWREDRCISIDLHAATIGYVTNSSVLQFFESIGVRLDNFYKYLWRHVLLVEILKRHLDTGDDVRELSWLANVKLHLSRKQAYIDAWDYLRLYSDRFFVTVDEQIREITAKVEDQLQASLSVGLDEFLKLGGGYTSALSAEERTEFIHRGQQVVQDIQLRQLNVLFEALNTSILTDRSKRYFVLIDQLDESWADDPLRYHLIRALIETMRDYNQKVDQVKIIIALRSDLFERVIGMANEPGFQKEKYRDLCAEVRWTREQLIELLDLRIDRLLRKAYTTTPATYRDVLPAQVGKQKTPGVDFMVNRTLMRPRDMIAYFNLCLSHAVDKNRISPTMLTSAEAEYSRTRLESLYDEWSTAYPILPNVVSLLKQRRATFALGDIGDGAIDELCLTSYRDHGEDGQIPAWLVRFFNGRASSDEVRVEAGRLLYRVGVVGIKPDSITPILWTTDGPPDISQVSLALDARIHVHCMFWRALGITAT